MDLELTFVNDVMEELDNYEAHYRFLFERICDFLNLQGTFILEVNLVSEATIQEINRTYRQIDRVTDVISFAFEDEVADEIKIVKDLSLPRDLGEIFICVKRAQSQAEEYHHSFRREMSFLFVHGVLHLLGYDHMNAADEKVMFDLQDQILDPLDL